MCTHREKHLKRYKSKCYLVADISNLFTSFFCIDGFLKMNMLFYIRKKQQNYFYVGKKWSSYKIILDYSVLLDFSLLFNSPSLIRDQSKGRWSHLAQRTWGIHGICWLAKSSRKTKGLKQQLTDRIKQCLSLFIKFQESRVGKLFL